VGAAEEPERIGDRAGERAADVAEELGLEEVRGDRAAVDGDEGPLGARRQAVDRRGDELLARAALTLDEHGRAGPRHLGDDLLHALHRRGVADELRDRELLAQALAQRVHLAAEEAPLHHPGHEVAELVEDQRLREVVVRPLLEGLDGRGDRRVARHHDDLDGLVLELDLLEELETAHLRHANVGDDGVEHLCPDRFDRLGAARGALH
jgi:hypothetical protein